ncbi:MAG: chemotaxis protein CheW [Syntrophorhabdaceae bacterium]|nr:chemotaxis protein CheW [Syntrophorhabdaceae bacterium]MDD5242755.1 chemotaxis protein CheW [Syntrophorhabdaceae bacterium]
MIEIEEKNVTPGGVESEMSELVSFSLDDRRFAVPLSTVMRVERIVAITPLPKVPDIVAGIINVHGQVIPVVDIRGRFLMTARQSELSDQLLIIKTVRRTIAFTVDNVDDVIDVPQDQCTDGGSVLPGMEYVKGVVKLEDGMILIHDPDTFLSLEEEHTLDEAIKEGQTQ